jgi:hypothetical protein
MTPSEKYRKGRAAECWERMRIIAARLGRNATEFADTPTNSSDIARLCRDFAYNFETRDRYLDELEIIRNAICEKAQGLDVLPE